MRSTAKKHSRSTRGRVSGTIPKSGKGTAAATIRRIGDDWVRHWNAENWTEWLLLTPQTLFTCRRTTEPFTDAMPFESI